jgi:hypothetical protein
MNDFTKEELEEISYCLAYTYNHEHSLFEKIQSMIDNFCEHDWQNLCCGCALENIWCDKCKRKF